MRIPNGYTRTKDAEGDPIYVHENGTTIQRVTDPVGWAINIPGKWRTEYAPTLKSAAHYAARLQKEIPET